MPGEAQGREARVTNVVIAKKHIAYEDVGVAEVAVKGPTKQHGTIMPR